MTCAVERVRELPDGFDALAAEAEADGFGALARMRRAFADGTNRFDRPGEAVWVARRDDRLVGICGLNVDPYVDDPACGRVRHLYVAPDTRRAGVGRALVEAALAHATGRFVRVRVRTGDTGAGAFYGALGFRTAVPADGAAATHVLAPLRGGGDRAAAPRDA